VWPPVAAELDERQRVACAARILAQIGFSENYAGHITAATGDSGNFWCTPWGLWWDEVRASDVVLIDAEGDVVDGELGVTPAIHIHTGLHRARPEARVVVHNHPPHATLLASHGIVPQIFTQTGLILHGEIHLVEQYTGAVSTPDEGDELAGKLLDGSAYLLANHGAITLGETVEEVVFKSAILEVVCRQAITSRHLGVAPLDIDELYVHGLQRLQLERSVRAYWDGAVRRLLRTDPEVLT
jgi:ribulose-5-phosphate 4-epimerase/fuculose-1-phosphate aldolase